jgi:5-methyltetrahydropteroyltriglutamate--homocysteine methyltransferase
VGTFLRPAELLEARSKFESGEIPIAELRQVEDKYIIDLVEKQKKNGLRSITDGDFRRGHWFLDFMLGLDGVSVEYGNTSRGLTAFLQVVGFSTFIQLS